MSIAEALSAQDWEKVVSICEESEQLNSANGTTYEYCSEHILALLLLGDVTETTRVWHRADKLAKLRATNAWNLAKALQTGNRRAFFSQAANLKWPTQVEQAMVTKLVDSHRCYTVKLISRAYSIVSISTITNLLGITSSEVKDLARANKWAVDDDDFVHISPKCRPSANDVEPTANKTVHQVADDKYLELQRLTEQVVRLQTT